MKQYDDNVNHLSAYRSYTIIISQEIVPFEFSHLIRAIFIAFGSLLLIWPLSNWEMNSL